VPKFIASFFSLPVFPLVAIIAPSLPYQFNHCLSIASIASSLPHHCIHCHLCIHSKKLRQTTNKTKFEFKRRKITFLMKFLCSGCKIISLLIIALIASSLPALPHHCDHCFIIAIIASSLPSLPHHCLHCPVIASSIQSLLNLIDFQVKIAYCPLLITPSLSYRCLTIALTVSLLPSLPHHCQHCLVFAINASHCHHCSVIALSLPNLNAIHCQVNGSPLGLG
jgi:hypothetical protein